MRCCPTVYRTYPLNDPKIGHQKVRHAYAHPSSLESVGVGKKISDTDLALQNLAKLNVSNKGVVYSVCVD